MIINHNMSAINANKVLKFKHWDVNKSTERLASGLRINKAADDASGMAIADSLRSQALGLGQAIRNGNDLDHGASARQKEQYYPFALGWRKSTYRNCVSILHFSAYYLRALHFLTKS